VPASTDAITREEFVTAVSRLAGSVYDFHARFSIPNLNDKSHYDDPFPRLCTRLVFLMEETGEHAKELNQGVLDRAVDEMADVAFVAMGTLLEMDSLGAIACREVANKNDKKTLQTHTVEPSSGKLIKRSQAK
jgi:NTP pyrophosphatase (non-canonical NTP hydrolase)